MDGRDGGLPETEGPETQDKPSLGSPVAMQAPTVERIKTGILVALTITITGLIAGFGGALYLGAKDVIMAEADGALAHVPKALEAALDGEAQAMSTALGVIGGDAALRAAFAARDRQAAQSHAIHLLASLRDDHGITCFSLHDVEGVNFLHVHEPARSGRTVAHLTFVRAAETGKPAHGIEIDQRGGLMLRVVHPWYVEGKLIGYVEMGKGTEHLMEKLRRSLGVELLLSLHKRFLNRAMYEGARRSLGRTPEWDLIPDHVVIDRVGDSTPPEVVEWLTDAHEHPRSYRDGRAPGRDLSLDSRHWRATLLDFRDAGGRPIGDLVALKDLTSRYADLREASIGVGLICLMLAVGLFLFFRCFLARLSTKLCLRTEELKLANETLTREIIERRNTENRLELFKHLIDQSDDMVLVIDAEDARLREANQQACLSLGYSRRELLALTVPDIATRVPDMLSWTMHVERLRNTGSMTREGHYRRKDGSLVPIEASLKYVQRDERGYIVAGVRDITMRRQSQAALRSAKDSAEEASRIKSQFLSNVSHEMRTPLNGIIGFAEGIASAETLASAKELSQTIITESDLLLELINTLLDHAKIEAGRLEIELLPFSPPHVLDNVVSSCSLKAQRKGLDLTLSVAPDVPGWVMGDAFRLRQVMLNLTDNAIKFTKVGSVAVAVENIGTGRDGVMLRFSVTDTGIGIAPDKQAKIFESFTQADGSTTRKFGGTGLGTTISKELVALMGGEIGVDSEVGKGSTFWFTLPVVPCSKEVVIETEREEMIRSVGYAAAVSCPPSSILAAEDYPTNQQVIRMHLEAAGHTVTIVETGRQAVDACLDGSFDLIFMDMQMPEMDGLAAVRDIRLNNPRYAETPIIGLTANAEAGARQACLDAGMNEVITKPVRSSSLHEAVARWLSSAARTEGDKPPANPADRAVDEDPPARPDDSGADAADVVGDACTDDEAVPIDWTQAAIEFCGDTDLLKTIIEKFLEKVAEQTVILEQAVAEGDVQTIAREAHKIKGGAANLMADPLARAAGLLETDAKLGKVADIRTFLTHLKWEFERLETAYRGEVVSR